MLNLRKLTILITATLVAACASVPQVNDRRVITDSKSEPQRPAATQTAEQLYSQAKQAPIQQQPGLLLKAVNAWQQQEDCQTALKVLRPLIPAITDAAQKDQARLVQSHCLLQINKPELAATSLKKVGNNIHLLPQRLRLSAQIAEYQRDYLSAARFHAELISLNPAIAESGYQKIWQLLEQLDRLELVESSAQQDYLTPWLNLARLTRQTPTSGLRQQLDVWQQRYPEYPLPDAIQQLLQHDLYQPQNIAVILPLSGRLANQGQALKEGIIAAYFDSREQQAGEPQLTFYDSVLLDELKIQNLALQHDFVVGPLLRENIPAILAQLPQATPALLLNRIEQDNIAAHRYFYSLAPEDEAEQLARHLHTEGYRMPILIGAGRPLYERMAGHFIRQWQQLERQQPALMTFTDNKSMREAVNRVLDIDQSERRIQQLQRLVNKEIYSFARNRRDVDAIVVFSDPAQTELLNPMIESSISPFADILPVFATSRSFSKDLGDNSLRDLRNLVFVDMPWMLPGSDIEIRQRVKQLWPNRSDNESRLFAMGYDAYMLIPELTIMRHLSGRQVQGLTGALHMNKQQQLVRQLPFGKIEQDQVVSLARD